MARGNPRDDGAHAAELSSPGPTGRDLAQDVQSKKKKSITVPAAGDIIKKDSQEVWVTWFRGKIWKSNCGILTAVLGSA
jgi:hypothetical protein